MDKMTGKKRSFSRIKNRVECSRHRSVREMEEMEEVSERQKFHEDP